MSAPTNDLPPPVNHVFVDFENVHEIDPAVVGNRTVHLTLLLGPKQTRLDAALVEQLLQHASHVELVRLTSAGRNALDFTLAYYVGRAVLADPTGYFHIVSKDGGYDPLIEHLRSKHIRARRHDDFSTLTFSAVKPPSVTTPIATTVAKAAPKPKSKPEPSALEQHEAKFLAHLRKPGTNRPSTKVKLLTYMISHLGKKLTEADALKLINLLSQAGHLVIDDKGKVTYHLGTA